MSEIRRAEDSDIPAILRLLVQVDMVHHKGRPDLFKGPATKYDARELAKIFRSSRSPVFVYVDDNGIVRGHAFCVVQEHGINPVLTNIRTLYIDDICIDEQARRQRIGSQLYQAAVAFAREQGCYNVTLNVWTCNPDALAFYESLGMQPQKIGMEEIL